MPSGYLKQDSSGKCLDSLGGTKGGRVSLFNCHGTGGNQVSEWHGDWQEQMM